MTTGKESLCEGVRQDPESHIALRDAFLILMGERPMKPLQVVEFFCRTCKRYFSKAVQHSETMDCSECDDSEIAWDDPKNPCDCPCHDSEIIGV